MDMKTLLRTMAPEERKAFAERAGTSIAYLYLIAGGHRRPKPTTARKWVELESRLTLAELRPDIWDNQTNVEQVD